MIAKKMKIITLQSVLIVGAVFQIQAKNDLTFTDENFNGFLDRIVVKSDQVLFSKYYTKISAILNDKDKGKELHEDFFKRGLAHLKSDHPEWFKAVTSCIEGARKQKGDENIKNVQLFLTRYGAYHDFLNTKTKLQQARKTPSFLDKKFDDFLDRVVAQEDKILFKAYYSRLSEEAAKGDEEKVKATHSYLFSKALDALEVEKKEWFNSFTAFISTMNISDDKEKNASLGQAQLFLRRYGAYQEFCEIKNTDMQENIGFFASIGSFFSGVGQTVVGWFGFGPAKSA